MVPHAVLPSHRVAAQQPHVLSHVQMVSALRPITVLVMLDIMDREIIALQTQLVRLILVKTVVHVPHSELATRIPVYVLLDILVQLARLPTLLVSPIPVKIVVPVVVPRATHNILVFVISITMA